MNSWHHDFKGRVNFAASYISGGKNTTRKFDSTCENNDGDAVVVALVRRAEANPTGKLAANLYRYISRESASRAVEQYKDVPTAELPTLAAKMRRDSAAADREHWARGEAVKDFGWEFIEAENHWRKPDDSMPGGFRYAASGVEAVKQSSRARALMLTAQEHGAEFYLTVGDRYGWDGPHKEKGGGYPSAAEAAEAFCNHAGLMGLEIFSIAAH